nr:hypothetical protein BaRGS_034559 [Batillaria attramentaria]
MKGQQQQSSSSSQDQKVLCQEDRQNQKADDAAQPDQTGSLESLETQAKPSLVKDTELDFAKAVKIAIETEDAAKVAKETVYGSKPRPSGKQLGKPKLDDVTHRYESASKHDLPVLGTFMGQTTDPVTGKQSSIPYIVTKIPDLNLLGRNAIQALGISVDKALGLKSIESQVKSEGAKESHPKTSSTTYASLQKDCHTLCDKFPDLFKEELGCLKDFELEVKFKSDAKPVFHKARPVPFALRDDLTKGYKEGIAKGVWKPVQFNDYGTPVVPIRKTNSAGALKPKLRICGDYSVGINDQLADHRHPMPLPEELMQKLGGGFGYTKIDLADAYNQIKLAPESQRRLALSTHRGGTPLLAANRLARWALWLNQFDYTIKYRKTADHGNADALSRLPSGDDIDFDREESGEDTDMVCAIRVLSLQVKPFDSNILRQESGKDPVIATVMRYVREGWPLKHAEINEDVRKFQKLSDSLSICHGCLIYGTRVVIPQSLQPKILDLLHIGHFGMERMKQLARTAVYWPAQGKQSKEASKTQVTPDPGGVAKVTRQYKAGDPVFALYYGPHHAKQPRWFLLMNRSLIMRSFHYLFIANLAMADLLCLGYWMTFLVLDLILGRHPVANEVHCAFNGFSVFFCSAIIPLINPDFVVTIDFALSVTLVLFFNCSVNWIVYGVMNRSFRRRYVHLGETPAVHVLPVSLSKISVDRLLQERARRQYFRNV